MPAPQLFKVLTEFRFEVGAAVASSNQLSGAVDKISESADNALFTFQKLGLGIVSNLSGASGGLLGVLGTASKVSSLFDKTSIQFATILGAKAGSFGERMDFAEGKIKKIQKLSEQFGISSNSLAQITKFITPAVKPKLGANEGFDKSINLGRVFLKAAPTLGLNPDEQAGQLQRAVLGQASMGDTLFNTLVNDTKAMAEFNGQSKKFNKLPLAERMERLTKAFGQFANDKSAIDAFTNTVTGQLAILRESFLGLNSVLLPLGRLVNTVIVNALQDLNKYIESHVRPMLKNLAFALEPFVESTERLFVTFMQFKNLKGDVGKATNITTIIAGIIGLQHGLAFLGIKIPVVTAALGGLVKMFGFFEASILGGFLAGPMTGILGFFNKLTILASRIIAPLFLLIGVFQFFSRVAAFVQIELAKRIANLAKAFSKVGAVAARIFAIFDQGFNTLAKMVAVSPVMTFIFDILEGVVGFLDTIVTGIALAMGTFQGLILAVMQLGVGFGAMITEIITQVKSFLTGGGFDAEAIGKAFEGDKIGEAFNFGIDKMIEDVFGGIENDNSNISESNTYINKVEIKNDFKEKFDADRIAFSLKDQLLKAAQNPTAAKNSSFAPVGG